MAEEQLLYRVENLVARIAINREAQRNAPRKKACEMIMLGERLTAADAREGITAFLEKRTPVFTGE